MKYPTHFSPSLIAVVFKNQVCRLIDSGRVMHCCRMVIHIALGDTYGY